MTPSVYVIDETLSSLMLMREEPDLTDAERAAIDSQIEQWMAAEVEKVDRVRAYLKHCDVMIEAAQAEADAQAARAKTWMARRARLANIVQYVMEAQQRRRCEGATGVLRLQGNGGKRALTITDASLVPDEYKRVVVTFSLSQWERLVREHPTFAIIGEPPPPHIDTAAVRKALEQKCEVCGGLPAHEPADVCKACNGTGGGHVPGAHLAERGQHLRVE